MDPSTRSWRIHFNASLIEADCGTAKLFPQSASCARSRDHDLHRMSQPAPFKPITPTSRLDARIGPEIRIGAAVVLCYKLIGKRCPDSHLGPLVCVDSALSAGRRSW